MRHTAARRYATTRPKHLFSKGFTLVEMVTVILILGIIVVGVSSFVMFGTRIFVESSSVDQVLSQSRFAVERMTRELRAALPNSVRVNRGSDAGINYQCIEFVPIKASTTYLTMPIAPSTAASSGTVILDNVPTAMAAGQWMWIYPLTVADVYDAAGLKRVKTTGITTVNDKVTVTFNAFRFKEASPRQRVFFASTPVSYCFISSTNNTLNLMRFADYDFYAAQPMPSALGTGVLMAQHIANNVAVDADLPIILTPASLVNNAMVHLQPRFNVNGETFQYRHQVQVINVP